MFAYEHVVGSPDSIRSISENRFVEHEIKLHLGGSFLKQGLFAVLYQQP